MHHTQLLNDLQLLSNEIKKKEIEFKKEIDHSISLIKENKIADNSNEIATPFITGLKSNKQKIISISLNCLIHLSSNFTLNVEIITEIIGILSKNFEASLSNPPILLKALQLILTFLSSSRYQIHDQNLFLSISICFKCLSSKDASLQQASCASINQIFAILLEKTLQLYNSKHTDEEIEKEFTLYALDTSKIFIDICAILSDNQTKYIYQSNDKLFCLQLIENLLENHDELCQKVNEYVEMLENSLAPSLIHILKTNNDFTYVLKALDITFIILKNHYNTDGHICASLIESVMNNIDSTKLRWMNILSFAFVGKFFMKEKLLLSVLKADDSKYQDNMIKSLGDIMLKIKTYIQNVISSWKPEDFIIVNDQNLLESLRTQEAVMNTSRSQLLTLVLNIFLSISNTVSNLIDSDEYNELIKKSCIAFLDKPSESILNTLSTLLNRSDDDDIIQTILKAYQSFTQILGELELVDIQNSFLLSLSKFSYHNEHDMNVSLTKKNIAVLKTILNIGHCMGNILGDSWILVLEPLKQLYITIHTLKKQLKSEKLTPSSKDEIKENKYIPTKEEYDIISKALDSLFTTSIYINDTGLIDIIKALKVLYEEILRKSSSTSIIKQYHLFGYLKMIQIGNHNLHRYHVIWPLLNRSILEGCNHPNSSIRENTMIGAISFIKQCFSSLISNTNEWKPEYKDSFQLKVLELIESMMGSKFEDIRLNSLKAIHQIILSYDQALTFGWNMILSILLNVSASSESTFISVGFKSINSIVNEYLSCIPQEGISVLISIIGNISGKKLDDVNININAIGLLWILADYIATLTNSSPLNEKLDDTQKSNDIIKNNFIDSLWLSLFHEASLRCQHESQKIRECSLHTLYGILKTHGNILNQSMWLYITENFLIEYFSWTEQSINQLKLPSSENIVKESSKDHGTDIKKGLHETQSILVNHFALIFKTYFIKISKLENFKVIWLRFLQFIISLSNSDSVNVMISSTNALKDLFLAIYEHRDNVNNDVLNPLYEEAWYTWQQMVFNKKHIYKSNRIISSHVDNIFLLFNLFTDGENKTFPTLQDDEDITFNETVNLKVSIHELERLFNILKYIIAVPIESFLEFTVLRKQAYPMILSVLNTNDLKELFPQITSILLLNLSRYLDNTYESSCYVISNEIKYQLRNYERKIDTNFELDSSKINGDLLHLSSASLKLIRFMWNKLNMNHDENIQMKANIFMDIQKVLGSLIQLKNLYILSPIWTPSLQLFIYICIDTLKLFRNEDTSQTELDEESIYKTWENIINSVKSFIIPPEGQNNQVSDELNDILLNSEIEVVNFIENLIHLCPSTLNLHNDLFEILIEICDVLKVKKLMKSSYTVLFNLLNNNDETTIISKKSLSTLMKRSIYLLNQIITIGNDVDSDSKKETISRYTKEVIFILSRFVHLDINVSLWEEETDNALLMNSSKRHLWELFPLLCECITIKEFKLKPLLKDIFKECSKELGLKQL